MQERKFNILELQKYREQWDIVCTDMMSTEEIEIFNAKKMAVDMYIDDKSVGLIEDLTKINKQNISRLINKCIQINPATNRQYGYSALINYKHVNNGKNCKVTSSTSTNKGAFNNLLLNYPQLKLYIEEIYSNKSKKSLSKNLSVSNLHNMFLDECRRLGVQDYEYPFNSKDKGKRSLYRYIDGLKKEIKVAATRINEDSQKKLLSTGTGERLRPIPLAPYSVVQIDGHKIDMLYSVEVMNKHGEIVLMPAVRMWLIAVIDVATRCVLGYHLTTNENYNQYDLMKALRNSIMPKIPMAFKISGLKYPNKNIGYPNAVYKELEWAIPTTIMMDNAKSHLAHNVIHKLTDELHISLNYGSVATPETRGIVERLFGTLEEKGYHRMPSTVGSNVNDVRRKNSEEDTVKYQITFNDIKELTEVLIATYNNSPHSALDNQSPLECMKRRLDAGMLPFTADNSMKSIIYNLITYTELKTIRGDISKGKRPYLTFKGVEYRNEILSQTGGMIGKKLIIEVNPDDISKLTAYFESGEKFGTLTAAGEWGIKSHSLKTRQDALKFKNLNTNNNNPFYLPLTEYEKDLNNRAEKERRARTKAKRIRTEQNKELALTDTSQKASIVPIKSVQQKQANINSMSSNNDNSRNGDGYYTVSDKRRKESYSSDELDQLLNAGSIEEAIKKGII